MSDTATTKGYRTTEFWLSLAAKLLGILFASGAIGDGSAVARVAGLAAMVLTALGYTVSRTMVKTAGVLLLAGLFATTQPACAAAERAGAAAKVAAIDCGVPKLATAAALVARWAVQDALAGEVQWAKHETDAIGFGLGVGSCAYAEFLRAWKAQPRPQALAIAAQPDPLAAAEAGLERLRARLSGAPIKLADGTVM